MSSSYQTFHSKLERGTTSIRHLSAHLESVLLDHEDGQKKLDFNAVYAILDSIVLIAETHEDILYNLNEIYSAEEEEKNAISHMATLNRLRDGQADIKQTRTRPIHPNQSASQEEAGEVRS